METPNAPQPDQIPTSNSIKNWDIEDRPREKMIQRGASALTDAELLAILIRTGSVNNSAVDIAKTLLKSVNGDLTRMGQLTVKELSKFKGLGEVKAVTLAASLELGRRRQMADSRQQKITIGSSQDAYRVIAPDLMFLPHEEFWIILLNRANHVISSQKISQGGVAGTVVDAKMVFRPALTAMASGVILAHNHPSGNMRPSQADLDLTRKLRQAGQALDVTVLDHLIIGDTDGKYYSFADEGHMS